MDLLDILIWPVAVMVAAWFMSDLHITIKRTEK